jgi:hypothetical protein
VYKLCPLTYSFVNGIFYNEKLRFLCPVVCELVPLYGSDGIGNKYNTIVVLLVMAECGFFR